MPTKTKKPGKAKQSKKRQPKPTKSYADLAEVTHARTLAEGANERIDILDKAVAAQSAIRRSANKFFAKELKELRVEFAGLLKSMADINTALDDKLGKVTPTVQQHMDYHKKIDEGIGELCEKLKKANDRIIDQETRLQKDDDHINRMLDAGIKLEDELSSIKTEIAELKKSYSIFRTVGEINQSQSDRQLPTPEHWGRFTVIAKASHD